MPDAEQTRRGVEAVLSVLEESSGAKNLTFFVNGQLAREQPELISELSDSGHEIGCHGNHHEYVNTLKHAQFKRVIENSTKTLEDSSGQKIIGYRAPDFSYNENCPWMYEVLAEAGFLYSSSVLNGNRRESIRIYDKVESSNGTILEFPVYLYSPDNWRRICVIGGTYFRLLPTPIIIRLLKKSMDMGYAPMIYLHPYDIDKRFKPVPVRDIKELCFTSKAVWMLMRSIACGKRSPRYWRRRKRAVSSWARTAKSWRRRTAPTPTPGPGR